MLEKAAAERAALLKRLDAFDAEFYGDLVKVGGEKKPIFRELSCR